MRAERNNNIVLALDNGHLMREEIDGLSKIDHMIRSALALGWAGIHRFYLGRMGSSSKRLVPHSR